MVFTFVLLGYQVYVGTTFDAVMGQEYLFWDLGQWNYPFNPFDTVYNTASNKMGWAGGTCTKTLRPFAPDQKDLLLGNNQADLVFKALVTDRLNAIDDQRVIVQNYITMLFLKDGDDPQPYFFPFQLVNLETNGPSRNRFYDIFFLTPLSLDALFYTEDIYEEDDASPFQPIDFYLGVLLVIAYNQQRKLN